MAYVPVHQVPDPRPLASGDSVGLLEYHHNGISSDLGDISADSLDHKRGLSRWMPWSMFSRSSSAICDTDSPRRGWKPRSMSPWVLVPLAFLSLVIAGAIEALAQVSHKQGGLGLSASYEEIPRHVKLAYLYVPTVCAVLYSLIWAWVDLDVKRMQPWFELSKKSGAIAKDSIFLEYPHDFAAFVPWRAAKRRHWPVLVSGTIMILVPWVITPLQSSILGIGVVTRTVPAEIAARSHPAPLSNNSGFANKFLLDSYAIRFLDQSFPPFATPDYTVAPFYVKNASQLATSGIYMTATGTRYYTELQCLPASKITMFPFDGTKDNWLYEGGRMNISDGSGCDTIFQGHDGIYMQYYGNYGTSLQHQSDGDRSCNSTGNPRKRFLAVWARVVPVDIHLGTIDINITALYCEPKYWRQQVVVSVYAENSTIREDAVQPVSDAQPLTLDEFNTTAFELISEQESLLRTNATQSDDPIFSQTFDTYHFFHDGNLVLPLKVPIAMALGKHHLPMVEYEDSSVLQNALDQAYKTLFATAMNRALINQTSFSNATASSSFPMTGVIVSRSYARAVETILIIVAAGTVILLWICQSLPSNLVANPSSISRFAALFRDGNALLQAFSPFGAADAESLSENLGHYKMRLSAAANTAVTGPWLHIVEEETQRDYQQLPPSHGQYHTFTPLVLRKRIGLLISLLNVTVIIILSFLKSQEIKYRGLSIPSKNFETRQILEKFLPTIFSTLLEPVWVLVTRVLCELVPFNALYNGRSKANESIDARYSSIPPQLVLWRAIKARHFLLAVVCSVSLLANVLTVGLGAIFNERSVIGNYTKLYQTNLVSEFNSTAVLNFPPLMEPNKNWRYTHPDPYQDHFYVAMENITSGAPLPPWTTEEFYFLPFTGTNTTDDIHVAVTRGFGARTNCTTIIAPSIDVNASDPGSAKEPGLPCTDPIATTAEAFYSISQAIIKLNDQGVIGRTAVEYQDSCNQTFVLGWARAETNSQNETLSGNFASCVPSFMTAMFSVIVENSGRVLGYTNTSAIEAALPYADSDSHTIQMMTGLTASLVQPGGSTSHNDSFARSWLNYLMVAESGLKSAVDPAAPPPVPSKLIPAINSIYGRLFAILLSQNPAVLKYNEPPAEISGTRIVKETRVFMEQAAFIIAILLLAIYVATAALVYMQRNPSALPRMPSTIASVLAYVAPSRFVRGEYATSTDTFSFGRYLGVDRKIHIGIEVDPFVVSLHGRSFPKRKAAS